MIFFGVQSSKLAAFYLAGGTRSIAWEAGACNHWRRSSFFRDPGLLE